MARQTKYVYLTVVQADYGWGSGWEDVAEAETSNKVQMAALRDDRRAYRVNCPELPLRTINRREPRKSN